MRPPDGHHQQDSLFLSELVYLASPTSIRKRANRTQAYIFHLWHASLGLCKTRQQTKAWMTASTSNGAINFAQCQSRNTMNPLIGSREKNEKKKSNNIPKHATLCQTKQNKALSHGRALHNWRNWGVNSGTLGEKKVFLGNSLLSKGIYSCNKAVVARGLGWKYVLWSHTLTFHRKL